LTNPVTDVAPDVSKETQTLEVSLRKLWDKIKTTSELIEQLKVEKQDLSRQVNALAAEVSSMKTEVSDKDLEIRRLKAERAQLIQVGSGNGFTDEEKEILKGRIKDLIAKINSHL
jgi:predicted  nucleic acid-binding Zn-ribbon protein